MQAKQKFHVATRPVDSWVLHSCEFTWICVFFRTHVESMGRMNCEAFSLWS